jgi:hypothetical protein
VAARRARLALARYAEVQELPRCVRGSYLLQKSMGDVLRACAGEEPDASLV